jgi:hypothetical protein
VIQFRWRPWDGGETHSHLHGHEGDEPLVVVNGVSCVLEYRQLFIPTTEWGDGDCPEGLIVLKPAREGIDDEWKPVMVTP